MEKRSRGKVEERGGARGREEERTMIRCNRMMDRSKGRVKERGRGRSRGATEKSVEERGRARVREKGRTVIRCNRMMMTCG